MDYQLLVSAIYYNYLSKFIKYSLFLFRNILQKWQKFNEYHKKPWFCEQFYDQVEVISVVVSLYFDKNERRIRSIKRFDHQQISNPIYFNYNICKIYIFCKNFNFGHIDTHHSDGIWKGKILRPRCTLFWMAGYKWPFKRVWSGSIHLIRDTIWNKCLALLEIILQMMRRNTDISKYYYKFSIFWYMTIITKFLHCFDV